MKAVVLLSGGLDSVVSLLKGTTENTIELALTFDYGQKASVNEIKASQKISRMLGIKHKVIELPFMQSLHSGLLKNNELSVSNSWVPNRNGLFINIGATFAENIGANLLICGFNKEEAQIFPDNSIEFVDAINRALYYSTMNHVIVKSYVSHMDKVEIIEEGISLGLDFRHIWSCYEGGNKPCGECTSCLRNKEAFDKAGIKYNEDFIC